MPSRPQTPVSDDLTHDDISQTRSPQGSNNIYVDYDDPLHGVAPPASPISDSEMADRTSGFSRIHHPLINGTHPIIYIASRF
jgi:hypothetical protein